MKFQRCPRCGGIVPVRITNKEQEQNLFLGKRSSSNYILTQDNEKIEIVSFSVLPPIDHELEAMIHNYKHPHVWYHYVQGTAYVIPLPDKEGFDIRKKLLSNAYKPVTIMANGYKYVGFSISDIRGETIYFEASHVDIYTEEYMAKEKEKEKNNE